MNFIKRIHLFETFLIIVILGIHLYAAFSDAYNLPNTWFNRDDAYYYFKVAQNITEGFGSTFDKINPTNGYHPLWMLVCIPIFALARFDLILPLRVLLLVTAIMDAATAVLIYRLIKSNLSNAVAIVASSFWAFGIFVQNTVYESGLETPLAAFAIVLFIYKLGQFEREWRSNPVTTQQIGTLALIATMVMFSRLDLVFLAVISGIWIVFRGKPIRSLLLLDVLIIFTSMTSSIALRTGIDQYNAVYATSATDAAILVLVTKIISLYFFGGYQHPRAGSIPKMTQRIGLAITTGSVLSIGMYFLLVQMGIGKTFPRSAFIIDWGISLLLILTLRLVVRFAPLDNDRAKSSNQTISPIYELQANWKKWLTEGAVYYGIVGGSLGLYMLYNKIAFGVSSPISGLVKRWWGTLLNTIYEKPAPDWGSFFGIGYDSAYDAWQPATGIFTWMAKLIYPLYPGPTTADERYYISMLICVVVAFVVLFINARRMLKILSNMALIPLAVGCGVQILSYTTTAYGGVKEWYWVGEIILITLIGSVFLDLILRPLQRLLKRFGSFIKFTPEFAAIILAISLAYEFGSEIVAHIRYNYYPADPAYRNILPILPILEDNTQPGDMIGMTGGGIAGYFIHDRTVVNMDGLINSPEYFHALQNKQAPQYLRKHGVNVIFANTGLLALPPYFNQFDRYLESYAGFGGKSLVYLLEEPK
jgi:hypothetical protein